MDSAPARSPQAAPQPLLYPFQRHARADVGQGNAVASPQDPPVRRRTATARTSTGVSNARRQRTRRRAAVEHGGEALLSVRRTGRSVPIRPIRREPGRATSWRCSAPQKLGRVMNTCRSRAESCQLSTLVATAFYFGPAAFNQDVGLRLLTPGRWRSPRDLRTRAAHAQCHGGRLIQAETRPR